jgi:hypothetical protein
MMDDDALGTGVAGLVGTALPLFVIAALVKYVFFR